MSRNAERMTRDLKTARSTMDHLTEALINDLVRRAGTRAITEPSASGPKGKGTVTDPTLSAVIRSMGKRADDPIYDTVQRIARTLADVATLCQDIDQMVAYVTTVKEFEQVKTIAYCQACGREVAGTSSDRIRSGYCMADYQAWTRKGRPYRTQFEAEIKAKISEKAQN